MASPVIASSNFTKDTGNTTSRNVTKPSGTASGDFLLHITAIDGNSAVTPPTGFTVIRDQVNTDNNMRLVITARIADGSEGANFTIGSANEEGTHWVGRITGSSATTVAEFVNALSFATGDGNNNGSLLAPSLPCYANAADTLVLRICGCDGAITITQPGSHTNVISQSATTTGGTGLSIVSLDKASAGYVALAHFTVPEQYACVTLVLNSTTTTSTPAQPVIRGIEFCMAPATLALTYSKPYGTVDGDLLLLAQTSDVTGILTNPGSAFTSVEDSSNTAIWHQLYRRVASSEGTSYTGSNTTTAGKIGVLMRITGADTTSPINQSSVATGNNSAPTASTITPNVDNCLVIATMGADDNDLTEDTGYPSGYTAIFALDSDVNGDEAMIMAFTNQTSQTATGAAAMALSASEEWVAIHAAIAPANNGRSTSLSSTEEEDTLSAASAVKLSAALASNEAEDTLSSSSKVAVASSAAPAEADDTLSSSASVFDTPIDNTLEAVEQDDTLAGSATVRLTASLASTEENDTAAASATVRITGSAAPTESDDTLASSTAVAIAATASMVESDDTLAATSAVAIDSTLDAAEQDDTLAASASAESGTATASLESTEDEDTLAASSLVRVTGAAAISEAEDTVVASASVRLTATAPIAEDEDTLSAAAAIRVSASLAATEDHDTLASQAAVRVIAQAAPTEEDDSLAAIAAIVPQTDTSLEATEEDDTLSAEVIRLTITDENVVHVAAENRTITVPEQTRTLTLVAENRNIAVASENRTVSVPSETRIYRVAA